MKPMILTLVVLAAAALPVHADVAPAAKKWKDSAEVSIVATNGNSKTQTTSGKELFSYQFDKETGLDVDGGGLGAKSNGVGSAEQYFAGEKVTQKLDERNYLFERYRWDRNRFAGVAHRHEISVGAGRDLWKGPKDLLIGELAPGYLNEERIHDKRKEFASARAFSKYTHDFSATAHFGQSAEYIQSLADKRDARLKTETSVTAALSTMFSIKNSYTWLHDSRPPVGTAKNDEIFSLALLASF
jgi:putative salt-induced outer membrane protein YdiY